MAGTILRQQACFASSMVDPHGFEGHHDLDFRDVD